MTRQKDQIAYSIPNLTAGITLDIKKSANAWWMDKFKVLNLLGAFRVGGTIVEACALIDITEKQYKYFAEMHPEIREIKSAFKSNLIMSAKIKIVRAIDAGDLKTCWRFLANDPEWGNRRKKDPPIPMHRWNSLDKDEKERRNAAAKAYDEVYKRQIAEKIRNE